MNGSGNDFSPLKTVQNVMKKKERTQEDFVDMLTSYFTSETNNAFLRMKHGELTEDEFLILAKEHLDRIAQNKPQEFKDAVVEQFKKEMWGFSVLEELVNDDPNEDETISDIKVVTYNNVRIKKNGERMDGGVSFSSAKAFSRFANSVAIKNGRNLSMINAEMTFTDNQSHPDWTLRYTIATEFMSGSGQPVLHIRKLPKKHKTLAYFEKRNKLVTKEQMEYFKKRINEGSGFLIVGKTGTGKTVFFNGLLDYIPKNKSTIVIQEYQELNNACDEEGYVPHPEMVFLNTIEASGEGRVEYDLKRVAKIGLRLDVDYFAIGEVKGGEAKYLLNCINTGSIAICSSHGGSIEEGMDKVADYITYESQYTKTEALAELKRLNTVIFIEDFRVKDVAEVTGYDKETEKLVYKYIEF